MVDMLAADILAAAAVLVLLVVVLVQAHRLRKARKEAAGWKLDYEWLERLVPEELWDKIPQVFTPSGRHIMVTMAKN